MVPPCKTAPAQYPATLTVSPAPAADSALRRADPSTLWKEDGPLLTIAKHSELSSYAPTSHTPACGRATPRWSTAGQTALSPALRAALDGPSAIVGVPPPLSARG